MSSVMQRIYEMMQDFAIDGLARNCGLDDQVHRLTYRR